MKGTSLMSAKESEGNKSSQNEGDRLDRLETMLSALLNHNLGSGSINSLVNSYLVSPTNLSSPKKGSKGPNCGKINYPGAKGSSSELIYKNNYLTIGLSTKINSPINTKWVLDSGATDHMIGNQMLLKNYRTIISDQYFTVVNDEQIKIKGWGIISIFQKKFLQNVFYVENCSVNLLSISKLSKELNCEIIFKGKIIFFQDLVTKELIGE
jgi:hypothetical protein